MNKLNTIWTDKVNKSCPLSEYPRPQFERKTWLCLNGQYDYAITDANASMPKEYDGKITVPFSVETELSGVQKPLLPSQRLWYHRMFNLGDDFKGKRVLLHFISVDWESTTFINGKEIGTHRGGYNPFTYDITDYLIDGENELVVKVYDPTDDGYQQRGKQFLKPVGFWYTATSGIWQTVWLESVSENHIDSIRLVPDIDKGVIKIKSNVIGSGKLNATVYDEDNIIFNGEIKPMMKFPFRMQSFGALKIHFSIPLN